MKARHLLTAATLILACVSAAAQTVIIYTTPDLRRALDAYTLSRAFGPVFIAHRSLVPGSDWATEIRANICMAQRVLVVWSKDAPYSTYLAGEIDTAIACNIPMIPIMLDRTPLPDSLSWIHAIDWR